jgi:hypothetical protein
LKLPTGWNCQFVPIGAFGDLANITKVAASIHQEPEEVVLNEEVVPEQEIEPMSEVTVPAVEATIPTAPIFAQAKKEFVCQRLANTWPLTTSVATRLRT